MSFHIVCYDTPSDRRRRRLVNRLKNYLVRVQKSVFEGPLAAAQLDAMVEKIVPIIDPVADRLRVYTVPRDFTPRILIVGQPALVQVEDVLMIGSGEHGAPLDGQPAAPPVIRPKEEPS